MLPLLALCQLAAAAAGAPLASHTTAPTTGVISGWLRGLAAGTETPVGVQLCTLLPATTVPPRGYSKCPIAGDWTYDNGAYHCAHCAQLCALLCT